MKTISVLFVCMGNICRSPTAHGVFRALVSKKGLENQFNIDSAGTHSRVYHHQGHGPDRRSLEAAIAYGIDISDIISRQFTADDFKQFDYIVVMDKQNQQSVHEMVLDDSDLKKISLLTDYLNNSPYNEVPDPYFVGSFDKIYQLIEEGCNQLLIHILNNKN
ncbi:low molecular weight phosphotyrosine protein phosphatase [Thiotrichales bacterium 19S3-7]|nr:low molecular weight phosphotyrosine protein phosphatase [Thiotrichales bacterium 19S3-7]MCF6802516.1 low molecular weight phosphotyrosine protein phosphatase [Thiotrichales bacterium 19S3-11]